MLSRRPIMLCILDGWGIAPPGEGNAIFQARTPFQDKLFKAYPSTRLATSGEAVGLPEGIMGNSEVGHLNIGAGRVVYQEITRINRAIRSGEFFDNKTFGQVISKVKKNNSSLHIMGLVSDGGVHSYMDHIFALIELAKRTDLYNIYVHCFTDGRDTPPHSGIDYIRTLQGELSRQGIGKIATVCGRFYAMDRDKRWNRVEKAYKMLASGTGIPAPDPITAVSSAYERGETDEFIEPTIITDTSGNPTAIVRDQDGIIFFNFRADRARELSRAFIEPNFDGFPANPRPQLADYVSMTLYDEHFTFPVAFPPEHLVNIFGEILSKAKLRQLRIAETEKYAHVTYFFNGGEETPFPLEDRCLIPSPKEVRTYDQKPQMSAYEVTDEVIKRIDSDRYDVIILNFANLDMVGHTGVLSAAVKACETVDECIAGIVPTVLKRGGIALITADHGNAEQIMQKDGSPHTAHTLNPVPFILVDDTRTEAKLSEGALCDIAPTMLHLMEIPQPKEMTGRSLLYLS
jgi:2,3-bisphosphoglycerate-independent phosphoglycerate mutase